MITTNKLETTVGIALIASRESVLALVRELISGLITPVTSVRVSIDCMNRISASAGSKTTIRAN